MDDADDDFSLFRQTFADVRRAPEAGHVSPLKRPPPPRAVHREADDLAVMAELLATADPDDFECGDTLLHRTDGVQDAVIRRLRRGQYRVERVLDLHGLNRHRARVEVVAFLAGCQRDDLRCVRIIHGKGNGSPNTGPVLKAHVDSWLRKRRDVLAFCSARPADGGTGAIYVLLRAS
jgi:DNA-nicking Smr family endonuclease